MDTIGTEVGGGERAALLAEGAALGRHLAGREVDGALARRYADGVAAGFAPLAPREAHLLALGLRVPLLLGPIDAACALRAPRGGLRRRFFLMLAILEASPDHADLFLPAPVSPLHLLVVGWAGARAVLRAAVGLLVTGVVR